MYLIAMSYKKIFFICSLIFFFFIFHLFSRPGKTKRRTKKTKGRFTAHKKFANAYSNLKSNISGIIAELFRNVRKRYTLSETWFSQLLITNRDDSFFVISPLFSFYHLSEERRE